MYLVKFIFVFTISFLSLPFSTQAQSSIDAAKEKDIRKLMEVTGVRRQANQMIDMMFAQYKRSAKPKMKQYLDEFKTQLSADEFIELNVPIYDKHLSHSDIKAILKFYDSQAGKNLLAAMPKIMEEGFQSGAQYGERIAQRITEYLRKKRAEHSQEDSQEPKKN